MATDQVDADEHVASRGLCTGNRVAREPRVRDCPGHDFGESHAAANLDQEVGPDRFILSGSFLWTPVPRESAQGASGVGEAQEAGDGARTGGEGDWTTRRAFSRTGKNGIREMIDVTKRQRGPLTPPGSTHGRMIRAGRPDARGRLRRFRDGRRGATSGAPTGSGTEQVEGVNGIVTALTSNGYVDLAHAGAQPRDPGRWISLPDSIIHARVLSKTRLRARAERGDTLRIHAWDLGVLFAVAGRGSGPSSGSVHARRVLRAGPPSSLRGGPGRPGDRVALQGKIGTGGPVFRGRLPVIPRVKGAAHLIGNPAAFQRRSVQHPGHGGLHCETYIHEHAH